MKSYLFIMAIDYNSIAAISFGVAIGIVIGIMTGVYLSGSYRLFKQERRQRKYGYGDDVLETVARQQKLPLGMCGVHFLEPYADPPTDFETGPIK